MSMHDTGESAISAARTVAGEHGGINIMTRPDAVVVHVTTTDEDISASKAVERLIREHGFSVVTKTISLPGVFLARARA